VSGGNLLALVDSCFLLDIVFLIAFQTTIVFAKHQPRVESNRVSNTTKIWNKPPAQKNKGRTQKEEGAQSEQCCTRRGT